jgi:GT2 family glycosyltransferase
MPAGFEVPIIIVGFGHSDDIVKCLNAIATQRRCPKFEVFICENGGPAAYDALVKTLTDKGAPCEGGVEPLEPRRTSSRGRVDYGSPRGRRKSRSAKPATISVTPGGSTPG